jgi:Ubiquitin family
VSGHAQKQGRQLSVDHMVTLVWEGATMFIYIITLTGKKLKLDVDPDETTDHVKTRIQDKEGFPPGKQ